MTEEPLSSAEADAVAVGDEGVQPADEAEVCVTDTQSPKVSLTDRMYILILETATLRMYDSLKKNKIIEIKIMHNNNKKTNINQ